MRFGTKVIVERGGGGPAGTRGCRRFVKGILVGAYGSECYVRLTEDDPLDTMGWSKKGDMGRWSKSVVRPDPS